MKDISDELKQEIMAYAKETSCWKAHKKYNIGTETIRYWIDPQIRKKLSIKGKTKYDKIKNTAEYKEYWKKYNEENKEANKERYQIWLERDNNMAKWRESIKQHYYKNKTQHKQKAREWYIKARDNGTLKAWRQLPINKMKMAIREGVRRAIKYGQMDKDNPSIEYLGCDIDTFKAHIAVQFKEGMSWDNHGRGEKCWHLDHIKPLAFIDPENTDEIKTLCHYTNYQPLWELENLQKQDKYICDVTDFTLKYNNDILQKEYDHYKNKTGYDYTTPVWGNKIVFHFQPHFHEKERELLKDRDVYNTLIENRKKYLFKDTFTKEELLRGMKISGVHIGYSHFSPFWIRKFIDDFKPKVIYDPCGGWGQRLIGASVSPVSYIYNDIWDLSCKGSRDIINHFNIKNVCVYNKDAASFTPAEDYDCVFTCPPYYNTELYKEGTSFVSLDQYENWWSQVIQSSVTSGVKLFAFVINTPFKELLSKKIPGKLILDTPLSSKKSHFNANNKSNQEYLLVYSL